MNNIQKFELEYNKYNRERISEKNRIEYTIGWIQGLMVLSAIVFPMLALMLSPKLIKVSPLILGLIILTTTIIGAVIWKRYESKPDFTEENLEKLDKEFSQRYCPNSIKKELLEQYKDRINQIQLEILKVDNKKVYQQMIEIMQNYQKKLSFVKLEKNNYSYYTLHKYIYFYHMFDDVKSFRNRNEKYFEPSNNDYSY